MNDNNLPWPFNNISFDRLSVTEFIIIFLLMSAILLQDIFGERLRAKYRRVYYLVNGCIIVLFVVFMWIMVVQIQKVS